MKLNDFTRLDRTGLPRKAVRSSPKASGGRVRTGFVTRNLADCSGQRWTGGGPTYPKQAEPVHQSEAVPQSETCPEQRFSGLNFLRTFTLDPNNIRSGSSL